MNDWAFRHSASRIPSFNCMSTPPSPPQQPPKRLKVPPRKTASVLRWRDPEARRSAQRKIEAIRREAERERLAHRPTIDVSVLRSPKVVVGMLLVMLVIGGLLASAFRKPAQSSTRRSLEQMRARRSLEIAAQAMTYYRVHTRSWPSQRLGLFALAKNYGVPGWKGPYINWAYKDPWGTPYVYRMPASPFDAPELFSCGADKLPDTPDDLRMGPENFTCPEGTWRREPLPEEPDAPTPPITQENAE